MEEPKTERTVTSCLISKYLDDDDENILDQFIYGAFTGSSPCKAAIRRALPLFVLDHMGISSVGDMSQLSYLVESVVEADLGWNKLQDWEAINILLEVMPVLRVLNLSHNPLNKQVDVPFPYLPNMKTMILNGTNLQPRALKGFLKGFPNLHELHLSDNLFENDDTTTPSISDSVRTLHLNRCNLTTWQEAENLLRFFPAAREVFLCENPIKNIPKREFSNATFHSVNLSSTLIDSWDSIENLSVYSSLTNLRLSNTPLMEAHNEEERIALTASRIPTLQVLNGIVISAQERERAERFFIRYYQNHENKPKEYMRLVKVHGEVAALANVDLSPKKFCQVDVFVPETQYRIKVRVNLKKKITEFLKEIEKKVGIRYARMLIILERGDGRTEVLPTMHYNMPLHRLRLDEDDVFRIEEKYVIAKKPMESSILTN